MRGQEDSDVVGKSKTVRECDEGEDAKGLFYSDRTFSCNPNPKTIIRWASPLRALFEINPSNQSFRSPDCIYLRVEAPLTHINYTCYEEIYAHERALDSSTSSVTHPSSKPSSIAKLISPSGKPGSTVRTTQLTVPDVLAVNHGGLGQLCHGKSACTRHSAPGSWAAHTCAFEGSLHNVLDALQHRGIYTIARFAYIP